MASSSPVRKRKELGDGEGAGAESPGLGPVTAEVRMASARNGSACLQAAGSGERALGDLLLEFSRAQYRARESGGAAGGSAGSSGSSKVREEASRLGGERPARLSPDCSVAPPSFPAWPCIAA